MDSQVVLVTGGSSGIGLATASIFGQRGWRVVICGRSEDRLTQAEKRLAESGVTDLLALTCNVADSAQVANLVEQTLARFGRLDVLVNNAGTAELGSIADLTEAQVTEMIGVNCHGIVSTTRSVWRLIGNGGGGAIINISSLASTDPFPGFSVYGATKAFVDLFSQATAAEGREANIRVYSLCPGAVETPLLRRLFPDFPADETMSVEEIANRIFALAVDHNGSLIGRPICM